MLLQFDGAVICDEVQERTSKKGNAYGIIRMIFDYRQWELFCFGDVLDMVKTLPVRQPINLLCELQPDQRGAGVRLTVKSATDMDGVYYG